jgi:hypothetical protein
MSITRLQQARQMYALGQLVSKTMDGSRPGYRGPGGYQGGATNQGGAGNPGSGNGNGNKGSDRPETTRPNPHTKSGESKTSVVTGDEMRSANRDFIQTLNTNNAIRAAQTGEKFTPYNNFAPTSPFATNQKKFGLFDLALLAASGGLFGAKIATGAKMFNTAKRAKNLFDTVTDTYDIKNPFKNVDIQTSLTDIFQDNKPSKSTTDNTTIKDSSSDREGIATLDNQAANYDEYILLLQKLQSGDISDAERNRYNVLKNTLGV